MSTDEAQDPVGSTVCPACLESTGMPFRVATEGPDHVQTFFRCTACRHEWSDLPRRSPGIFKRPRLRDDR